LTPSGSLLLLSGLVKVVTVCLPVLRSSWVMHLPTEPPAYRLVSKMLKE
jgi:hypothetical protein